MTTAGDPRGSSEPSTTIRQAQGREVSSSLAGAIAFLGAYLAVMPVVPALSTGALPLPGSAAAEVAGYLRANPAASLATGLLQGLSVAGLALVVAGPVARMGDAGPGRRRPAVAVGAVAVALMAISAVLSVVLSVVVPSASDGTISALRAASFYSGGVAHVVTLGAFVWLASRPAVWTRAIRVFGVVSAVPAGLSVLSLVFFYASALLPLGRLLCMVWTVSAAVSLSRRRKVLAAA